MLHIFVKFFVLGWISFGGPAAHIGYFRHFFVEKERWLTEEEYSQFVALSQFLPGPGSSQVGFSIGYQRAGLRGGLAAFLGFTLPSVILMLGIASLSGVLAEHHIWKAIMAGLKIFAVVVVIDAIWGMFKHFCQCKITLFLCIISAVLLLFVASTWTQIAVLVLGATLGKVYLTHHQMKHHDSTFSLESKARLSTLLNWPALLIYLALLLILPLLNHLSSEIALFNDFFQAGSLVFGGGHVVLPLLQQLLGEQINADVFLTGYATAQAVPGPMFTFATFLGFEIHDSAPILGALIATLAVFLPGFLLIIVFLKNWQLLAKHPAISGALMGVNAAVVGLLLATLYQPVFQSAVHNSLEMGLVILGVYLLKSVKIPIVVLVLLYIALGGALL